MEKRPAHPPLNDREMVIAVIGGLGLLLLITAGLLVGFGTVDDSSTLNSMAITGLFFIVASAVLWMVMLTPWKDFDDLKTPYYTGHHDDHHDDHGEDTHGEIVAAHASAAGTTLVVETTSPAPVEAAAPHAAPTLIEQAVTDEHEVRTTATPNNLKIIEGIGPKVEAALNTEGITTFEQLANKTPEELEYLVKQKQGVRIVGGTETWPLQARLAASGDLQELTEFQQRIKGGIIYDYLERIEGIGFSVQRALHEEGILTFRQLIDLPEDYLKDILKKHNIIANVSSWKKQAEMIVAGDIDGLKAYQDRIRSGKES